MFFALMIGLMSCGSGDNTATAKSPEKDRSWNLTTPSTDYVHSGTYSARLESKKVIVKFAAGNLFAGKYLDTKGLRINLPTIRTKLHKIMLYNNKTM